MTTDSFRHVAIGLALLPAVISSAAELSAHQAPLAHLGIDRGAAEVTQLGSATRWAGRIAPVTALGIGVLGGLLSSAAFEYEPCTGAFEGFLGGAMGGDGWPPQRNRGLWIRQPTVDAADYGARVGVGLRAGWYMGFGGSLRMGASLRGDWIASSPMGSMPMITLGIGLWG